MDLLLGFSIGTLIAFFLSIPAMIIEWRKDVDDLPLLIDIDLWRGRKLTTREAFGLGLILHLMVGGMFGLLYIYLGMHGWLFGLKAFSFPSMLLFAFIFWIILDIIILKLFGLGSFGAKQRDSIWYETALSIFLEAILFWMLVQFYQPFFF